MILEATETGNLRVTREPEDKKYYGVRNAAGESNLLHAIKVELNKKGFDLIKKRMWKDGHLVDDMQQYLRTRSIGAPGPHVYIYNHFWAHEGAEVDFNAGEVVLTVIHDIYDAQGEDVSQERFREILSTL